MSAAAGFSGGGVSPARVLGPAIVFHCHWNFAWAMCAPDFLLSGAFPWQFRALLFSSCGIAARLFSVLWLALSAVSQHPAKSSVDSTLLLQGPR